jgi:hypothetical protein
MILVEDNVVASGVGERIDGTGGGRRGCIGMHPHMVEALTEAQFGERANRWIERFATRLKDFTDGS